MKRRELLKKLGLVSVAAPMFIGVDKAKEGTTDKTVIEHRYKGYRIIWTGWKRSQNCTRIVGQWLAWPTKPTDEYKCFIYSSCPGSVNKYGPGETFDTSCSMVQRPCLDFMGTEDPEILPTFIYLKERTLNALLEYIDNHA